MKVTPIRKKFGKYQPGDEFDLPDKAAKLFIKVGKLQQVNAAVPTYQTRMMQPGQVMDELYRGRHEGAAKLESEPDAGAPYGYKADGTPRKRPGRPAAATE